MIHLYVVMDPPPDLIQDPSNLPTLLDDLYLLIDRPNGLSDLDQHDTERWYQMIYTTDTSQFSKYRRSIVLVDTTHGYRECVRASITNHITVPFCTLRKKFWVERNPSVPLQ